MGSTVPHRSLTFRPDAHPKLPERRPVRCTCEHMLLAHVLGPSQRQISSAVSRSSDHARHGCVTDFYESSWVESQNAPLTVAEVLVRKCAHILARMRVAGSCPSSARWRSGFWPKTSLKKLSSMAQVSVGGCAQHTLEKKNTRVFMKKCGPGSLKITTNCAFHCDASIKPHV